VHLTVVEWDIFNENVWFARYSHLQVNMNFLGTAWTERQIAESFVVLGHIAREC
jgi:hypothetical protein